MRNVHLVQTPASILDHARCAYFSPQRRSSSLHTSGGPPAEEGHKEERMKGTGAAKIDGMRYAMQVEQNAILLGRRAKYADVASKHEGNMQNRLLGRSRENAEELITGASRFCLEPPICNAPLQLQ